jgi:hypothetical protein
MMSAFIIIRCDVNVNMNVIDTIIIDSVSHCYDYEDFRAAKKNKH